MPKITFSIVPDEETGSLLGTQRLFETGILPQDSLGMLMPEPTSGVVWNANKGALTYRVTLKGRSAHVSLEHQGVNAFEQMVEVVNSLLELKKKIKTRKTQLKITPPEANQSVMLIGGEANSGVNFNVVPDTTFFTIDRRINPEDNFKVAKGEIIKIIDNHRNQGKKIDIEVIQEGESSSASQDSKLALALHQSIIDMTGTPAGFELCPGLLETRFFNNWKLVSR